MNYAYDMFTIHTRTETDQHGRLWRAWTAAINKMDWSSGAPHPRIRVIV